MSNATNEQIKAEAELNARYYDTPGADELDAILTAALVRHEARMLKQRMGPAHELITTTSQQDAVAERAAEMFDALMGALTTDHERRVEARYDRDVRRMQHRIQDVDFGYAEPLDFADCPGCGGECCYVRDDVGKQSICLECGFRYTDRAAASDARMADAIRDRLIADGKWPLTPVRFGPAIAGTRTTVETREAEVA